MFVLSPEDRDAAQLDLPKGESSIHADVELTQGLHVLTKLLAAGLLLLYTDLSHSNYTNLADLIVLIILRVRS